MTSILDGYEVFEGDDGIMDGIDDTEYFEIEIEETTRMDVDDLRNDEDSHPTMWHDFDQINPDDLPC